MQCGRREAEVEPASPRENPARLKAVFSPNPLRFLKGGGLMWMVNTYLGSSEPGRFSSYGKGQECPFPVRMTFTPMAGKLFLTAGQAARIRKNFLLPPGGVPRWPFYKEPDGSGKVPRPDRGARVGD